MKRSKGLLALVCLIVLASVFMMACSGNKDKEEPKDAGKYNAGTYEATEKGYGGDVTVVVTLSADKIDAVEVKDNEETPELGGEALKTLTDTVLSEQKTEVDVVSGATVTSEAFIKAVTQAVKQGEK